MEASGVRILDLNTVEVNGTQIPIKGPSCIKCPRMPVCDIYKNTAKFFNDVYPLVFDKAGEDGKPLPEDKQMRPFPIANLALVCKYYAGLDKLAPSATK